MSAIEFGPCIEENTTNPLLKIITQGLNDPISTLLIHVQELNKNCFHDQTTLETLSLCEESVKILAELIENANFLADSKEYENTPDWFLVKSHIKNVLQELKLKYPNAADISVMISFSNRFVYLDEKLLRRVLINLLSNSLKFSWKGRIELMVSRTESGLEIIIRDSGIGIPEKEIQQIFKPFVHGSNARNKPGWGLGLAVVIKSLENLGGKIEVNSTVGRGSEFKLLIPCKISNEIKYDNIYS